MRNIKSLFFLIILLMMSCFYFNCTSSKNKSVNIQTFSSVKTNKDDSSKIEKSPNPEKKQGQQEKETLDEPLEEQNSTKKNETAILEEALFSYQDAQISWEKGDLQTALAALDNAYSLILKLDLAHDSPLIQEKNDLRLLIARRIQEIYASSKLTAVGENGQTILLVENEHVKKEIKRFQTDEHESFLNAYKRSGKYRNIILNELKKAGLPEDLSWLPMIESWFKVKAYSRARALGLWQFISSTGYRFGLKRDRWIDERMDPEKSTKAAVKYLKELHALFGDWTTALAAYNCGEFKVQRIIRAQRIKYLDNFWDLYLMLPQETARFVPRFIATLLIIKNHEQYGFNLPEPDPPLKYEQISINQAINLSSLSKNIGLDSDELSFFNPELRHNGTPDYSYNLKIPPGYSEKAKIAMNSLSRWIPPEASYVLHYVRRGETLSGIASRYRTSVSSIARLNHMRRVHLIRPGQRLKIPLRGRYSSSHSTPKVTNKDGKLVYTVRRGDSLYLIARMFNTNINQIKKTNNLKSDILHVGQKLVIRSGKPANSIVYKVKPGDTPFDIARRFKMNLNTLLNINGLNRYSKIYPGQELWVTRNQ